MVLAPPAYNEAKVAKSSELLPPPSYETCNINVALINEHSATLEKRSNIPISYTAQDIWELVKPKSHSSLRKIYINGSSPWNNGTTLAQATQDPDVLIWIFF